jgi:hypothetical protein
MRHHVFQLLHAVKYTAFSPIDCRLMSAPNQMATNSCSLILTLETINLRVAFTDPSSTAFPAATDINDNEEFTIPPPMQPHTQSPVVVVPPTSSRIPKPAN